MELWNVRKVRAGWLGCLSGVLMFPLTPPPCILAVAYIQTQTRVRKATFSTTDSLDGEHFHLCPVFCLWDFRHPSNHKAKHVGPFFARGPLNAGSCHIHLLIA